MRQHYCQAAVRAVQAIFYNHFSRPSSLFCDASRTFCCKPKKETLSTILMADIQNSYDITAMPRIPHGDNIPFAHATLPQRSAPSRHSHDGHSTALPSGNRLPPARPLRFTARAGGAWPWRHHRRALAIYLRTGRGRMALASMSPYTPLRFTGSGKGSLVSDLPPARPLRQCARWGIHTLARRAGGRRLYAAAVSHMPRQTEQAEQAEHTAQRDWRYARLRAAHTRA